MNSVTFPLLPFTRRGKWPRTKAERARQMTAKAIRLGLIQRLPCDVCGSSKSEAHHEDYDAPNVVIFLCISHHRSRHASLGWGVPHRGTKYNPKAKGAAK